MRARKRFKYFSEHIFKSGDANDSSSSNPTQCYRRRFCLAFSVSATAAVDVDAAKELARANNCFKCHGVSKDKDGPSYEKVAAKYKGKPDAEEKLIHHLTSGEKAKFPDGHEEEHKNIKGKASPEAIKNLADWILSL